MNKRTKRVKKHAQNMAGREARIEKAEREKIREEKRLRKELKRAKKCDKDSQKE